MLIQEVLNLLPDVTSPQFVEAHNVQTNDELMCVYMGSLVRTVIALHNLIDNKVSIPTATSSAGPFINAEWNMEGCV